MDQNKDKKPIYKDSKGKMVVDPRFIPNVKIEIIYTLNPFELISTKTK